MAAKKRGLGRGLDSLFEDAAQSPEAGVTTLPLREIEPDKDQPRKEFSEEALAELAGSIAEHGLLQPIAVRPAPSASGRYQRGAGNHPGGDRRAGDGACPDREPAARGFGRGGGGVWLSAAHREVRPYPGAGRSKAR